MSEFKTEKQFVAEMDAADPLASFREQFFIPNKPDGTEAIYLCGNSLGLQPKATEAAVLQELEDWQKLGVDGHFQAKNPWLPYHEFLTTQYAAIVGAKPSEVVAMNTLTSNLHFMMVSFYRPTKDRYKILIEANAFPSDQYAVQSQIKYHGFDPEICLIELEVGEDINTLLEEQGETIALIMLGGLNYYSGELFDMESIVEAGHAKGCVVGFDLAHAAGNVPLKLHAWNVDFACWCSYKYLNSGPGSVAGCFVHERHADDPDLPRFSGWWGHDKESRFKMGPDFKAIEGAEGWQLSNPPILSLAAVRASLDIFVEAGMDALREKSVKLTAYMEFLLNDLNSAAFKIITPTEPEQRGAQLSIVVFENGKQVHQALEKVGVVCDWREPDCIRAAPVPLYNSFEDVFNFVQIFAAQINADKKPQEAD